MAGQTPLGSEDTLDRLGREEADRRADEVAKEAHRETHRAMESAADARWQGHLREHAAHDKAHAEEHVHEVDQTRLEEAQINTAFAAHQQAHEVSGEQIKAALAAVDNLAQVHAKAHEREHVAHDQRHSDAAIAVSKAEAAVDKRLEGMNAYRDQLREQARMFASNDTVSAIQVAIDQRFATATKHTDERYEENRRRIEALEKGDVKAEGRSLGQGAVVAIIVTAIGVVGTVLAIIITLANVATGVAP